MHTVVELSIYLNMLKALGLKVAEQETIKLLVASNPTIGDEIVGSGGIRKFRVAGNSKGKSGGYRVFAKYFGLTRPVYLMAILSKTEKDNLTKAELKALKQLVEAIESND